MVIKASVFTTDAKSFSFFFSFFAETTANVKKKKRRTQESSRRKLTIQLQAPVCGRRTLTPDQAFSFVKIIVSDRCSINYLSDAPLPVGSRTCHYCTHGCRRRGYFGHRSVGANFRIGKRRRMQARSSKFGENWGMSRGSSKE